MCCVDGDCDCFYRGEHKEMPNICERSSVGVPFLYEYSVYTCSKVFAMKESSHSGRAITCAVGVAPFS